MFKQLIGIFTKKRQERTQKLLSEAMLFLRQGSFGELFDITNRIISLDDRCSQAHFLRGLAFDGMGNWAEGITSYSRAIELNSNDQDSYRGRSVAYFNQKQYDLALEDANRIINKDENNLWAHMHKGVILLNAHNRKLAKKQLEICRRIEPNSKSLTMELEKLIKESHDQYQDERGVYNRLGDKYMAGYWGYRDRHGKGKLGFLWTTRTDEALEVSDATAVRISMTSIDQNPGESWVGIAVDEAKDIR